MARDFQIPGGMLIRVKGAFGSRIERAMELGLTLGDTVVSPRFIHYEKHVDDFGPDIPAELHVMLAEVFIEQTLVHVDEVILDTCLSESLGGAYNLSGHAGILTGAGTPLGGYQPMFGPGCHYISLNIIPPAAVLLSGLPTPSYQANFLSSGYPSGGPISGLAGIYTGFNILNGQPYRFRTCVLTGNPVTIPLGRNRTAYGLRWRCIPYSIPIIGSSGNVLPFNYDTLSGYASGGVFVTPNYSGEIMCSGTVLWDRILEN